MSVVTTEQLTLAQSLEDASRSPSYLISMDHAVDLAESNTGEMTT
jgi:hypothetical protein